jgi:predicted nucleic acid-binding protein
VSYLFDTNAISETFRPRPNAELVRWLDGLSREEQHTSTVVIAELYVAAYRSPAREKWLGRIEKLVLSRMTVLTFDLGCAHELGRLQAALRDAGAPIGEVDTQIAATALQHRLTIVTANDRHFRRVPGLVVRSFSPGSEE